MHTRYHFVLAREGRHRGERKEEASSFSLEEKRGKKRGKERHVLSLSSAKRRGKMEKS